MEFLKWVFLLFVTLHAVADKAEACHPREGKEDEGDTEVTQRKKRHAPDLPLEDFFAQCMGPLFSSQQVDLRPIVDYTIRQTSWFSKSEERDCAEDTVDCWRFIITDYLADNSNLLQPAKTCMERYGVVRRKPATSLDSPRLWVEVPPYPFRPPLNIDQFAFAQQLQRQLFSSDPTDDSFRNMQFVVNFFRFDTICRRDFCDCSGLRLPPGEACGQNWYTRVAALTKLDSPARPVISAITNSFISNALSSAAQAPAPPPPAPPQTTSQLDQLTQLLALVKLLPSPPTTVTTMPMTMCRGCVGPD